jgi:hypothetical protein
MMILERVEALNTRAARKMSTNNKMDWEEKKKQKPWNKVNTRMINKQ